MHLKYTQLQNSYTAEELQCLLKALGFPRDLFTKNLPETIYERKRVKIEHLIYYCDHRYFNRDLHFSVNMKPGAYNVETLKRSITQVASRLISFEDLESVRLAYETYEDYDQRGMMTTVWTILKALKLCGRMISPLKLTTKLRRLQQTYKECGRIQFYEFLDLLALCEMTRYEDDELAGATDKTWRDIYCIDEFDYLVLPKEKKLWRALNEQYRQEELKYGDPQLMSEFFKEKPVNSDDFHLKVRLANKDYDMTRKRLKESNRQILLSKGGTNRDRPQHQTALTRPPSRRRKLRKKVDEVTVVPLNWAVVRKPGTSGQHSPTATTVTAALTQKSAPVQGENVGLKCKKARPQSCPPVVNDATKSELNTKMNEVKFDMSTKGERWKIRVNEELSLYLDDPELVLERLRRPPSVPGQSGQKRRHRRPRVKPVPSPRTIKRLAQPWPILPRHHTTHCDAITLGLGGDNHAVSLRRHGKRVVKKLQQAGDHENKRKKSLPVDRRSRASLLERLLHDIDTDSCHEDEKNIKEKHEDNSSQRLSSTADVVKMSLEVQPEKAEVQYEIIREDISHELAYQPRTESIKEKRRQEIPSITITQPSTMSVASKYEEALSLLNGDYSKIFLDPKSFESTSDDEINDQLYDPKFVSREPSRDAIESSDDDVEPPEETEFEKFVKDENNLVVSLKEREEIEKSDAELRRMRKSLKRLSQRLMSTDISAFLV